MSALALYLEDEGLSTVCIALVREHAVKMRPPRALWVPFALGRPFGPPGEPELQRRVILSAFELLERKTGPVLEDFPDVPVTAKQSVDEAWVCPVSFPGPAAEKGDRLTPVLDEIRALQPWYGRSVEQRGRTTVGASGRDIDDAAQFLVAQLAELEASQDDYSEALVDAIRWCADDLKAFYFEAVTAQTGTASQTELERWFWQETQTGELLADVRRACLARREPGIKDVGEFMLVPDAFV